MQEDSISKLEAYDVKYSLTGIVFDVYKKDSLKAETRSKRGSDIRSQVSATIKVPVGWKGLLSDDSNKTELFDFLTDKVCRAETMRNLVIATKGNVVSTNSSN